MKKNKIEKICIRKNKITQEKHKEIFEQITYYHEKAIKQKLDNTNLSEKDKVKILSNK